MRMAIVQANGLVVNVIELEPGGLEERQYIRITDEELAKLKDVVYSPAGTEPPYVPPKDCTLVDAANGGSPGDVWDGEKFITPEPVEPELTLMEKLEARIKALEDAK